jgi:hypothetical protein
VFVIKVLIYGNLREKYWYVCYFRRISLKPNNFEYYNSDIQSRKTLDFYENIKISPHSKYSLANSKESQTLHTRMSCNFNKFFFIIFSLHFGHTHSCSKNIYLFLSKTVTWYYFFFI